MINDFIENMRQFFNKIISIIAKKVQEIKIKYEDNKKWTLFLYLNGQCIAKKKIDKDFAPMKKIYVVKVRGMKHITGTNRPVQLVVNSYKYKYTDEKKKTSHIEVVVNEGVMVNE